MPTIAKTFIFEGKTFTSVQLSKEIGCSISTALRRLQTCNTIEQLYMPVRKNGGSDDKIYTIEGVKVTVTDVMKKLNCVRETARNRIYTRTTLKELYEPIKTRSDKIKTKTKKVKILSPAEIEERKMNRLLFGKW